MKIAICSRQAPINTGGLAAYQRLLANSLRGHGEVAVLFVCSQANLDREFEAEARDSVDNLFMLETKWLNRWLESLFPRLAKRRSLHSILERLCDLRWGRDLRTIPGLNDCDAIHYVGTGWDFFGFALQTFAQRNHAGFTVWPAVHPNAWGDDCIDLRLYNYADRVFCQSKFEAQHLIARGLDPKKPLICGLPPMCREDGEGASLRRELQISDRPAVLFLGRRDSGKGYPALLAAWPKVVQTVPDAVLLLAGPGGAEFEALKHALPEGSYKDIGVPDEKQKANAFAACDVFCLPSSHESFGIVYVEAWSYGKAVICGSAPASRELVEHGVTGLHADQSEEVLLPALLSLLKNRELRMSMGESGRRAQGIDYSVESMLEAHLQAFA